MMDCYECKKERVKKAKEFIAETIKECTNSENRAYAVALIDMAHKLEAITAEESVRYKYILYFGKKKKQKNSWIVFTNPIDFFHYLPYNNAVE